MVETQVKVFDNIKQASAKNLLESVKFSDDPKIQSFNVGMVTNLVANAFDEGTEGAFARQTLEQTGIKFDHVKAQSIIKQIEEATVGLTIARGVVGVKGTNLDPVTLRKAEMIFDTKTRDATLFINDIIKQVANVTATGKTEDVKAAVAKIPVPVKARPVTKGSPSPPSKKAPENPHPYRSPEYYSWYADRQMAEQEQRAAAYR